MNKIVIGIIVTVILVGGGVFVLSSSDNEVGQSESSRQSDSSSTTERETTAVDEATDVNKSGTYVEYSDSALASAEGTDRVLFFHAEWCSTCKFFEGDIKKTGVPEGVTVIEIDYDSNQELRDKYDVTVQSTFVLLDETGEVVQKWPFASGLKSAQDLFDAVASEA
jgi:thiol-disulfide isomerase/thioredoxin